MNQDKNSKYFHIPLPGDEPQMKAGFYNSAPVSTRIETNLNTVMPQKKESRSRQHQTMQAIQTNSDRAPQSEVARKKNALNAYLLLLIPFLGPAFSLFLLRRMTRFFVYAIIGILFLILPSDGFAGFKGIISLYIFVEFFMLLFTIPKLDRTDHIPGKYWS